MSNIFKRRFLPDRHCNPSVRTANTNANASIWTVDTFRVRLSMIFSNTNTSISDFNMGCLTFLSEAPDSQAGGSILVNFINSADAPQTLANDVYNCSKGFMM